jgi:hypothetical protein
MEAIFGSEEGKGEFELIDEMEKASEAFIVDITTEKQSHLKK